MNVSAPDPVPRRYHHAPDGGVYVNGECRFPRPNAIIPVNGWIYEANGLKWIDWWCGEGWHISGNDGPDDDRIRRAPACMWHLGTGVKLNIVGSRYEAIRLAKAAHRSPAWGRAIEALTDLWSEHLGAQGLVLHPRNIERIRRKAGDALDGIAADPTKSWSLLVEKSGGDLEGGFAGLIDWADPEKWLRRRRRRDRRV
jgi:hypothetical protein